MKFGFILSLVIGFFSTSAFAVPYKVDEAHTGVTFKVKHLVISTVTGRFNKFSGSFDFDEKKNDLKDVQVKIEADSIDTNEPDRDKHLKSKDFFEVSKYPTLEFKSTKVTRNGDKKFKVAGDLTIHGVTKSVVLNAEYKGSVTDPWGNHKLGFELQGEVNRKDFGLNWNKTLDKGGVAVSDQVKIVVEGEAALVQNEKNKK